MDSVCVVPYVVSTNVVRLQLDCILRNRGRHQFEGQFNGIVLWTGDLCLYFAVFSFTVLGFVIAINLAYNDAFFKESTVCTKIAHFKNQVCSQFFVGCSVESRLRMEAVNDMWALKETCREAFECAKSAPSATQQQVSETLRRLRLSVEDEARCPKSGYSIDMQWSSRGGRGQWSLTVLRTSLRAGRQRVPP